ncbi:MAG: helix-turn-helix transcriptional regulator [Planctomycetota bacterium]
MLNSQTCPCDGNTLDRHVQPSILIALAKGPLHGYRLSEQLAEMPLGGGRGPDMAGIYRTLQRMERQGFVTATWDTETHGPAKKTYQITEAGRQCLSRWVKSLDHYRRGLGRLLREAQRTLEAD